LSINLSFSRPFVTMSIKRKLWVSAAATIVLALVVVFAVALQYRNLGQAINTERFAGQVIRDVSDLNSLSYAYLLLKDKRPKVQWQLKHASLGKVLSEHAVSGKEEEALLSKLRSNHAQIKSLFDVVSERVDERKPDTKGAPSSYDELNEGVTAQLMARTEMMTNDATLLGRASSRRMDAVRRLSIIFVFGSAALLILSASLTASFLAKSIGSSLRVLEQGTQRIAAGDLTYRIPIAGADETSRLSAAFNDMTEKLETSHSLLEAEIAERTRAEEVARQQADLIELSHDAILVRDMESRILFWSRGAEETYGWTRAEALGNVTHTFLKIKWPVPFDEHMAELTRESRWEGELVHTRKDGSTLIVLSRHALQRDKTGKPGVILEINVDITERRRAEEETKIYATQLEASNRELQDFAFIASHDLQEPLRKIQAFGDQLKRDCGATLGAEGADFLARMQNAAVRMQALIQALLNYSRVTTKSRPFTHTDLAAAALEAVSNLETSIKDTGGQVEIGKLARIDADPVQMVQLFQNLMGNSLKFHGKEKPVVRVYGQRVDGDTGLGRAGEKSYRIFVEDNGIGFDEKYLDRIFTPFQRLHGRGVYEGTGIGLAICRKIVDRHNGSITAKSKTGKGTIFIVDLPIKQPKEQLKGGTE
jgi:PAS domain S-box-containing protein